MQRMRCSLSVYQSSFCFSKWPNWPKNSYSGPQNKSRQYQAFIWGGQSSDRAALFCCVLGGAEVVRVNRTLDPNRPAPGNWRKKWPVPPNTCAEWSLTSWVEELSTDYSVIFRDLSPEGLCTHGGALIDSKVIAHGITLIIICGFQNLRLVQSFLLCVMHVPSQLRWTRMEAWTMS